jgi:hypothetical protein
MAKSLLLGLVLMGYLVDCAVLNVTHKQNGGALSNMLRLAGTVLSNNGHFWYHTGIEHGAFGVAPMVSLV